MKLRDRKTPTAAGPTTETLALKLGEAEVERDRAAAALEAFESTTEESLALVDGGEALGEVSPEQAAADRGEIAADGDALKADAARTSRAVKHVQARLIEAAREAAEALKAGPLAEHRSAVAKRDATLRTLAKDEERVTAARAAYRQVEEVGLTLIREHDPAERERHRANENRRKAAILWSSRQVGTSGVRQLPAEWRDDALAAVEARNAEAAARSQVPASEDGSLRPHEEWPRLGAA